MATSTIHTKQQINNPTLRFSAANGPDPTSENSYPRYELRNAGVSGASRELCVVYQPDSNTNKFNVLIDTDGKPAFGAIMVGWSNIVTIPANSDHVALTASVPSDCRFLCWVGASSRGNATTSYIEFMDLPSTNIWVDNKVNYARDFTGYFLYCRGLNAKTTY